MSAATDTIDLPLHVGTEESSAERVVWAIKGTGVRPPGSPRAKRLIRGATARAIVRYAAICVRAGWIIEGPAEPVPTTVGEAIACARAMGLSQVSVLDEDLFEVATYKA